MITVFVLFMMIVIEYINVQTRSRWLERFRVSIWMQLVIAALLGIIPGCLGAFTVVSLYTHGLVGLGGLVATMIATSGDESFVMFTLFPVKALLLNGILFIVAVSAGWIVHLSGRKVKSKMPHGFDIHEQESCECFSLKTIIPQLKALTFERAVFILVTIVFTVLLVLEMTGHSTWNWKDFTFLAGSFFLIFVFITVPDHFLKEHLYNHILKRHLIRIFLWTWAAFIILHFIQTNTLINNSVLDHRLILLLFAVLIGIIPESGPNLVFVTLFSQNLIPFSILLSNSIVQDGHGMLPLLAESRKDFIRVKIINVLVGFIIGVILLESGI